jgi:hypothetical protein
MGFAQINNIRSVRQMENEISYIDLLYKLKSDVQSDNIPKIEKGNILEIIEELETILWKYSY